MVNNVQRNTLRGTYAGDQYDASGRQRGTLILSMGPTRAISRKPMVNNVQPKYRNTLRGTYAGDQYDASGRQRGTLILHMGPTVATNGTSMVDNVRSRHSSSSLTITT